MATRENIVLPKVTRERISADPSTWAPKLTTACPVMDKWLRGGVPTRHVTELTGEAGAAKTQLALQLLLNAQLPREVGGLDGAAVYVHTEGRAPLARLRQMISKREIYSTHLPPDHDPLDYVYLVKTLEEDPESLIRMVLDPAVGLAEYQARELAFRLGLEAGQIAQMVTVLNACYRAYRDLDATMVRRRLRRGDPGDPGDRARGDRRREHHSRDRLVEADGRRLAAAASQRRLAASRR